MLDLFINSNLLGWAYTTIMILYGLTTIGIILVVVSENRNPLKSLAWVTVLLLLPVVGIILYIFFGRNIKNTRMISRRNRRKLKNRQRIPAIDVRSLNISQSARQQILLGRSLTGAHYFDNNKVEIYTDGRSKFIPVTSDSLRRCHYRGAAAVVAEYLHLNPRSRLFSGKSFILGGSFATSLQDLPDGVKFLRRDPALDSDSTLGEEIYDAFTAEVHADLYVLAHATSPFIRPETIDEALEQVRSGNCDSAFSAEKIQTFAWYEGRPLNYSPDNIPRTQTIEPVYNRTSCLFIFPRPLWCERRRRIGDRPYMAVVDRIEGMDIDYPEDFAMAEVIASARGMH